MQEPRLEINIEEAKTLLKKMEYTYKKKGSVLIEKLKAFIDKNETEG